MAMKRSGLISFRTMAWTAFEIDGAIFHDSSHSGDKEAIMLEHLPILILLSVKARMSLFWYLTLKI